MPLFNLSCKSCENKTRKLAASAAEAIAAAGKCECGGCCWFWAAKGPSTQTMERLDNGIMPRAVERLANAEELHHDRARNADPLSGGAQKK